MIIFDIILVALKSLMSNRMRSFLSMLGIIIGVGAVIMVVAISSGAERQILDRLDNMGTNLITITPGITRGTGGRVSTEVTDVFTLQMAEQILALSPSITKVSPFIEGQLLVIYGNVNRQNRVRATTPEFFDMADLKLANGRLLTKEDVDDNSLVVVMGSTAATNLFDSANPVGQQIKLVRGNLTFTATVVGVLESKGSMMFGNYDTQMFMPVTTWMNRIQKVRYVNGFAAQARSNEEAPDAVEQIEYIFYQRYNELGKVTVTSQTEMLNVASDYTATFKFLIGGIASIALLVGGIGIMNITLVSVTERTREIGIRKALGAKRRVILLQFLIEACTVSMLGGVFGLLFGILGAMGIARFGGMAFVISPSSVALSIGFSTLIGLFFGIYPASRAAKLDPVDALSYE